MNKTFGFIGFGKLGSVLSSALADSNTIEWIVEKNDNCRKAAINKAIASKVFSSVAEVNNVPDIIFLAVEDSVIERTAIELSEHLKDKLKGKFVIHCSGALSVDILESCKKYGADIAVIHPYQTFYYPSENILEGIGWSMRSENRTEELTALIKSLGGIPFELSDDIMTTSLYHSSAVVASNFLNTLLSTSEDIANLAGIPEEKFIPQIVKTTIENNFSQNNNKKDFPLTGPYARADLKTIENHIEALKTHPHLLISYCYFALATIEKLRHDKIIDGMVLDEMERVIKINLVI